MPVIQNSVVVAANATNDNVLTGSQYEFLPYAASLQFGICGSAAGLECDIYSGSDTIAERMAVNAQNRFPINPDDYNLNDVAGPGERLKLRVRNTTPGALTLFYSVLINPI